MDEQKVFEKTLESLFPLFQDWIWKEKGFHSTGISSASSLILWYEFIDWVEKRK